MSTAADQILDAFASQQVIGPLTDADPELDGYAVARDVHDRRVAAGARPAGRKIGFTNRLLWPHFGIWAPIWAHVYDTTLVDAPEGRAELAVGHLLQPVVEPEVQLHIARTPPVTRDEEELLQCIDWISLGFEIVQCPFRDWQFKAADCVAAGSLHAHLVCGPPVPVADIEDCIAKLRSFTMTLMRGDEAVADGAGANVLDSPLLALAHLLEVLADQYLFEPVQAGEVITTGTLTAPPPAVPGDRWRIAVDGIELVSPELTLR